MVKKSRDRSLDSTPCLYQILIHLSWEIELLSITGYGRRLNLHCLDGDCISQHGVPLLRMSRSILDPKVFVYQLIKFIILQ